ncbi:MAG: hypothetical protein A2Z34_08935 [Planctomycetes bacterium RBG_16_59_8]|nr:MAG: hypothetical protein A2Z34_08935 [Planctomycetes bacterium RBG_16_59_8]
MRQNDNDAETERHALRTLAGVMLKPHSACNCRCIMCDIWKKNSHPQQLDEADIRDLLISLKRLETRFVLMTGGEPLMHPAFFRLCGILRAEGIRIALLSTGLLVERHAQQIVDHTDGLILSIDGSENIHDEIRRVPGAFRKLREGVRAVRNLDAGFRITGNCVIQRANFADWPNIVPAAHELGLDQIGFTTADVLPTSFGRSGERREPSIEDLVIGKNDLVSFQSVIEQVIATFADDFDRRYISDPPDRLRRFYDYFASFHGLADLPPVRCNIPWVFAAIEADGAIRPCQIQNPIGNIKETPLHEALNSPLALSFRRNLDTTKDPLCRQCVCSKMYNASMFHIANRWTGPLPEKNVRHG